MGLDGFRLHRPHAELPLASGRVQTSLLGPGCVFDLELRGESYPFASPLSPESEARKRRVAVGGPALVTLVKPNREPTLKRVFVS